MEHREGTVWLVLGPGRRSWELVVRRTTQRRPALKPREIAFRLNLSVPASLFEEPTIEAELTLPESSRVIQANTTLTPSTDPLVELEAEVLPSDEEPVE